MAPLNPYFGMNGGMAAEDAPHIPGADLSGMDLASLRNFDLGSLYGGGLLGGAPMSIDAAATNAAPAAPTKPAFYYADPSQMVTITGQRKDGGAEWLWQPTEKNTTYQDYVFGGGENNYLTQEVAKYLQALGYAGNAPGNAVISDADSAAINAFLQDRGLKVQTGRHQIPGASQNTSIQRIIDANGNPVAVNAHNHRYGWDDRLTDVAKVGAIAAAGYGLGSAAGLFGGGASAGGSGLLGQLANSGVGKAVGSVADAVGGGKNLAGIVGGLAGAMEGGKSQTATTTQQIDPRMAQYLYGSGYGDTNSMLGAAQQWFQNNRSGMNANMQQGLDTLKNLYTSPSYSQGYSQMRDVGQGLLGRPIAGNPFTQGGLLGAPIQAPMQPPIQAPGPDIGMPQFPRPAWSI